LCVSSLRNVVCGGVCVCVWLSCVPSAHSIFRRSTK
jgi:hypothetical protein